MVKKKYLYAIFTAFNLQVCSLFGQKNQITDEIKNMLKEWESNDPALNHSNFSFSLREPGGKILIAYHADKSLIPASNLKVITTVTALEVLGDNFKFATFLNYSGSIDKAGNLQGDIYLKGGGDPTLGSEKIRSATNMNALMMRFVEKIRAAGIKRISGNIYGDGNFFPFSTVPDGWTWGDVGNYYGASAGGLNLNDNLFKIIFKPGVFVGDSTTVVKTDPEVPGLALKNGVLTGGEGTGDQASVYGGPYGFFKYMTGTIPKEKEQFSIKASLPDPALFAAQVLFKYLVQAGIQIDGIPGPVKKEILREVQIKNLYTHFSPDLREIVQETNMQSLNLFAEALYKMSAVKFISKFSYDSAGIALKDFWKKKGMDVTGMAVTDGCGLSFTNTISANQLTYILNFSTSKPYFGSFYNSLPVSGVSGTLSRLTKGTAAEGKIHAKTGTQTRVSCYSGFVESKNGGKHAFSLLINNYDAKPSALSLKIEKLFLLLVKL